VTWLALGCVQMMLRACVSSASPSLQTPVAVAALPPLQPHCCRPASNQGVGPPSFKHGTLLSSHHLPCLPAQAAALLGTASLRIRACPLCEVGAAAGLGCVPCRHGRPVRKSPSALGSALGGGYGASVQCSGHGHWQWYGLHVPNPRQLLPHQCLLCRSFSRRPCRCANPGPFLCRLHDAPPCSSLGERGTLAVDRRYLPCSCCKWDRHSTTPGQAGIHLSCCCCPQHN